MSETVVMQRGATERETCDLNGWGVGTVLRGHEQWRGGGAWTTIRITAIGEQLLLARCLRHEYHDAASRLVHDKVCDHGESTWTLSAREWSAVNAETARPSHEG